MKKIPVFVALCSLGLVSYAQDSMNKKMENKSDKMVKKMENNSDKMNKKIDNKTDSGRALERAKPADSPYNKPKSKTIKKQHA